MSNWKIWGATSDAQLMAQAKYDYNHTKAFSMKLNLRTDRDVIYWLRKQKSKQGAIKKLIRDEIDRSGFIIPPAE